VEGVRDLPGGETETVRDLLFGSAETEVETETDASREDVVEGDFWVGVGDIDRSVGVCFNVPVRDIVGVPTESLGEVDNEGEYDTAFDTDHELDLDRAAREYDGLNVGVGESVGRRELDEETLISGVEVADTEVVDDTEALTEEDGPVRECTFEDEGLRDSLDADSDTLRERDDTKESEGLNDAVISRDIERSVRVNE
jgi:hypothetical protein